MATAVRLRAGNEAVLQICFNAELQDTDLQDVFTRFSARAGASHGLLARLYDDEREPTLLCSVGKNVAAANWIETARPPLAALAKQIDQRLLQPASEPVWISWPTCGIGARALVLLLAGNRGESLVAILQFDSGSGMNEQRARAATASLWPELVSYVRLWCSHCEDLRRITGLTAALDLTQLATMVLDTSGDLLFSNRAANQLVDCADGLRRDGRSVAPTDFDEAIRFKVALNHIIAEQRSAGGAVGRPRVPILSLPRSRGGRSLVCAMLPVSPPHMVAGDPAVVVYILIPQADVSRLVHPICRIYGMSPVETRLVIHLAAGLSLSEAAQAMRVKEHTARTYIKQIFMKTDTNRQVDLVRLVLTSIVPVFGDASANAI